MKTPDRKKPQYIKRIKLYLFTMLLLAFSLPHIHAQESSFVSAAIQDAGGDLTKLENIIHQHESLLKKYPNGEFAPTIMFQLAELYEQKSTLVFQKEMEKYEKDLDRYDKGEIAKEPMMPRISMKETLDYCYQLREKYPNLDFQDKILYKIAMSHLKEGNPQKANIFFQEIIDRYPNSAINLESHFRIGEYYFDKRDYKKAIANYSALLGKWDNSYFDMALYKLGWSYYNVNDYTNAISTFLYLIEDISLVEKTKSQILAKSKTDLRSESIQYIASCFTEYGGVELAKQFLVPLKDKDYSLPIFLKMGELYQKRNYYPEAIATYKALLEIYPYYKEAPDIYKKIIDNYEMDGKEEEANKAREELVANLGPGGPWLSQFSDGDRFEEGFNASKQALIYLGNFYQSEAQKKGQMRDYHLAINKYQEFLDKFPKDSLASKINYYLAEAYYGVRNYSKAAEAYYDVITKYDDNEYSEDSAYNRILCYYQLVGNDQPMDSVTIYIDEFLGSNEILTIKLSHQSEIDLLRACNDFSLMFSKSKWYDQVLMKYGEILHDLRAFLPAVKVYKKVVQLGPDRPYHLLAAMNAGQCYFDGGFFKQADVWFSSLAKNFPDSTQYVEKAQKMAASSKFKIAEQLSKEGKSNEAASLLSIVAVDADDPKFQERALFEAASQYQKAGDANRAALSLEKIAHDHPKGTLADEALYKAGAIRESNQQWSLAATDYLHLADTYKNSKYALKAVKNAAICFENVQDWTSAKHAYDRLTAAKKSIDDDYLESTFKGGEMAYKMNNFPQASTSFREVISAYKKAVDQGKDIDNYFAAQAQFMLGEIIFKDYKTLELKPPLNINLKRKVAKFQQVFQAYKGALEYQVADWSTAASYRIGMALEEFVRAFMESPAPPGLKGEDLKLYTEKLREKTRPYKKQALATYTKNVRQAEANHIENSWVEDSRKRIEALSAELAQINTTDHESQTKGS